jgi:cysteine synthase
MRQAFGGDACGVGCSERYRERKSAWAVRRIIPHVLQEAIGKAFYGELVPVAGAEGIAWSRKLAQQEGILTGVSGGATSAVAMKIAEQAEPGSVILCMLPDTGERYLSSPLFEGIPEEMTVEEVALSRSTPGFWMG